MKNNGFNVVVKEIKQRIKSETTKLLKYVERNNQIVQKTLFQTNQKLVCEKIKGKSRQNDKKPTAEESWKVWRDIWFQNVEDNEIAE